MNRNGPWWLTFQAVAIVASILLAFGIEAWWSSEEERETEQIYLEALLEDIGRLQSLLIADDRFTRAVLASTTDLLQLSKDQLRELELSEIDQLIGDIIWYNDGADWNSGPLLAIYEGGELRYISNSQLRLSLTRLYNKISTLQAYYRLDVDFHHATVVPFLIAHADWPQITQFTRKPDDPDYDYNYPDLQIEEPISHAELIAGREFRSLLVGKMDRQLDIINFGLPGVSEELSVSSELVTQELGQ